MYIKTTHNYFGLKYVSAELFETPNTRHWIFKSQIL